MPMKKVCPRCGVVFDCKHDEDIRLCHCASIDMNADMRNYLREHYADCLCHDCLQALKEQGGGEHSFGKTGR